MILSGSVKYRRIRRMFKADVAFGRTCEWIGPFDYTILCDNAFWKKYGLTDEDLNVD